MTDPVAGDRRYVPGSLENFLMVVVPNWRYSDEFIGQILRTKHIESIQQIVAERDALAEKLRHETKHVADRESKNGDVEQPCVLAPGHYGFCVYDQPTFVPCVICNGQPSDPVHDGGPKGHPYLVGPL